jgi:hypothetical protein
MFLRFNETRGYYLKRDETKPYVNYYIINDEFVRGSLDAPNKNPRISIIHPRDPLPDNLERLGEEDILIEFTEVRKIPRFDEGYLLLSMPSGFGVLKKSREGKVIGDISSLGDCEVQVKLTVHKE